MVDIKLIQGDCLEKMQDIPDGSIDMILCDLPYGMTACKWDSVIPFEPLWAQYKRVLKDNGAIVLTASQPFTGALVMSNPKMFKHEYVWFKNVPTGMAQAKYAPMKYHESVLVFSPNAIKTFNKQFEERMGIGKDCYNYEHYCGESNHVKMDKVKKFYDAKLVNPTSVLLFNVVPNRNGKLHPTQKHLCSVGSATLRPHLKTIIAPCCHIATALGLNVRPFPFIQMWFTDGGSPGISA